MHDNNIHEGIKVEIIGNIDATPMVSLIFGVHGNETAPLVALDILRKKIKENPINKSIKIIYANTLAIDRNLRYIEKDLNTCFFYNSGSTYEERLANSLVTELSKTKYNFDFHSTDFDIDEPYGLVSVYNDDIKNILPNIPIKNYVFTDKECLIKNIPNGIGFEMGNNSDSRTIKKTLSIIESIIDYFDRSFPEKQKELQNPKIFLIYKLIDKKNYISISKELAEFKKILSGDLIGIYKDGNKVFASEVCYPMWMKEKEFIRIAKKITIDE